MRVGCLQRPHSLGLSDRRYPGRLGRRAPRRRRGRRGQQFLLGNDAVFVRTGSSCLKIDLLTGRKIAEFKTPVGEDAANRNWGYVACVDGILFGSVLNEEHTVSPRYKNIRLRTESVLFFAMDARHRRTPLEVRAQSQHPQQRHRDCRRAGVLDRSSAGPADRITDPQPNGKHRPTLAPGEHPGGTLLALDARQRRSTMDERPGDLGYTAGGRFAGGCAVDVLPGREAQFLQIAVGDRRSIGCFRHGIRQTIVGPRGACTPRVR